MLQGFDTSHHQGGTDWAGLKSRYGIEFGFAKGTEHETFKDSQFPTNWSRMRSAGLVRGAYHFARPDTNPVDDARNFFAYVRQHGLLSTDLFVLDLEVSDLTQEATNAFAKGWSTELRSYAKTTAGFTVRPGLYMGGGYLTNRTGKDLSQYFSFLWYPRWPSAYEGKAVWPSTFSPPPPSGTTWTGTNWGRPPDFWQFSDSFPAAGEPTDANVFNGDLAKLRSFNQTTTGGGGTLPGKEEDMPTAEEVAKAVWDHLLLNLVADESTPAHAILRGAHKQADAAAKGVALLLARDPADVDEQALAQALAPLLQQVDVSTLLAAIQALPDQVRQTIKDAL